MHENRPGVAWRGASLISVSSHTQHMSHKMKYLEILLITFVAVAGAAKNHCSSDDFQDKEPGKLYTYVYMM